MCCLVHFFWGDELLTEISDSGKTKHHECAFLGALLGPGGLRMGSWTDTKELSEPLVHCHESHNLQLTVSGNSRASLKKPPKFKGFPRIWILSDLMPLSQLCDDTVPGEPTALPP